MQVNLRIYKRTFRWPTSIETLVIGVIVAVVVMLAIPTVKWASSGSLRVPVRVTVVDGRTQEPISGAKVAVFQGTQEGATELSEEAWQATNGTGSVEVEYEIETGASSERPVSLVHLDRVRVAAQAEGYEGKVIRVREIWQPTDEIRASGAIEVLVGLMAKE